MKLLETLFWTFADLSWNDMLVDVFWLQGVDATELILLPHEYRGVDVEVEDADSFCPELVSRMQVLAHSSSLLSSSSVSKRESLLVWSALLAEGKEMELTVELWATVELPLAKTAGIVLVTLVSGIFSLFALLHVVVDTLLSPSKKLSPQGVECWSSKGE